MRDVIPIDEGRKIFGPNSRTYLKARPDYPTRIYEILQECRAAANGVRAFEIGAGTGQATAPLLELGCTITAIEPDENMANTLKDQLKHYGSSLTVIGSTFEESVLPHSSFDLGYAAMSLHWLEPSQALSKVNQLLRPGGWWAMWWTVFGDSDDMDDFQCRTQHLFAPLSRSPSNANDVPFGLADDKRKAELQTAGFDRITHERMRWEPTFTTQQMVSLIATFSPVSCLTSIERTEFLKEIGRIVDVEFGGEVRRKFSTAFYLARKPH